MENAKIQRDYFDHYDEKNKVIVDIEAQPFNKGTWNYTGEVMTPGRYIDFVGVVSQDVRVNKGAANIASDTNEQRNILTNVVRNMGFRDYFFVIGEVFDVKNPSLAPITVGNNYYLCAPDGVVVASLTDYDVQTGMKKKSMLTPNDIESAIVNRIAYDPEVIKEIEPPVFQKNPDLREKILDRFGDIMQEFNRHIPCNATYQREELVKATSAHAKMINNYVHEAMNYQPINMKDVVKESLIIGSKYDKMEL